MLSALAAMACKNFNAGMKNRTKFYFLKPNRFHVNRTLLVEIDKAKERRTIRVPEGMGSIKNNPSLQNDKWQTVL